MPLGEKQTARRWCAVLGLALALSGCADEAKNPLLSDPLSDLVLDGATRVDRKVTNPASSSITSKQQQARVSQRFRSHSGRTGIPQLTEQLQRLARAGGWSIVLDNPSDGLQATKTVDAVPATLTAGSGNEPDIFIVSLTST